VSGCHVSKQNNGVGLEYFFWQSHVSTDALLCKFCKQNDGKGLDIFFPN